MADVHAPEVVVAEPPHHPDQGADIGIGEFLPPGKRGGDLLLCLTAGQSLGRVVGIGGVTPSRLTISIRASMRWIFRREAFHHRCSIRISVGCQGLDSVGDGGQAGCGDGGARRVTSGALTLPEMEASAFSGS
nr:hypothetical protein [Corynebacterium mendelii]